ncbi:MAG: hypothetical protein WBO10_09980 [Pyrinomonadaceae bacterium]
MNRRKLDNKTLDAIGGQLVKSDAGRRVNIDVVVSNPRLFAMVRERIAADRAQHESSVTIFSLIKASSAVLAGGAALVALVFGTLSLLKTGSEIVAVNTIKIPDASPVVARPVIPPQGIVSKLSAGRANDLEPAAEEPSEMRVEKAVYRTTTRRPSAPRQTEPVSDVEPAYYPVSYTGNPAETAEGGQIIRVQMNRSSLFALGVNLPLENDDETVSADLVVGRDGVTRAIRVVYE